MSYVDAAAAPLRKTGQIKLYGAEAFEGMRKAGRLVAECLDMLVDEVKPGVPTERIDRLVFEFAMDHDATPATLMYRGYRKATCTSINHVVCHGIPGEKPLREGDIVNIDVTLILNGWHGDSSRMFAVGEIPRRAILSSWSSVLDYCRTTMAFAEKEQFRILFLDKRNQLIADEVQQTGTVDHAPVYPREVVKRALELSATALILVHNHPSGDPTPSRADIQMTQSIVEIAKPLGISVHDHIIVGKDGHASFKGLKLI